MKKVPKKSRLTRNALKSTELFARKQGLRQDSTKFAIIFQRRLRLLSASPALKMLLDLLQRFSNVGLYLKRKINSLLPTLSGGPSQYTYYGYSQTATLYNPESTVFASSLLRSDLVLGV